MRVKNLLGPAGVLAVGLLTCAVLRGGDTEKEANDCEDRVTGGGWIITSSGGVAHFEVGGGFLKGQLRGHLNYHDQDADLNVKATEITSYQVELRDAPICRTIRYDVEINGEPGTAIVEVCDGGFGAPLDQQFGEPGFGEPGADDVFEIALLDQAGTLFYFAGNTLAGADPGGGNIQLHKPEPGCE